MAKNLLCCNVLRNYLDPFALQFALEQYQPLALALLLPPHDKIQVPKKKDSSEVTLP